jgi:hypothetical protein
MGERAPWLAGLLLKDAVASGSSLMLGAAKESL